MRHELDNRLMLSEVLEHYDLEMPITRCIASANCYLPNRASTAERNPSAILKRSGKNSIGENYLPMSTFHDQINLRNSKYE